MSKEIICKLCKRLSKDRFRMTGFWFCFDCFVKLLKERAKPKG